MATQGSEGDRAHIAALAKLCRLCGKNLNKRSYDVVQKLDLIQETLLLDFATDKSYLHPLKICFVCNNTLVNVTKRSATTKLTPVTWTAHEDECTICKPYKNIGRPLKIKRGGRRKSLDNIWTHGCIQKIRNQIPKNLTKISKNMVSKHHNSHLELCFCRVCNEIIHQPIILTACQHSMCFQCLVPLVYGKEENDTHCPICNTNVLLNTISYSQQIHNMIQCLVLQCSHNCGKIFTIKNYTEKLLHEKNCFGSSQVTQTSTMLSEAFSTATDVNLTREMQDAALHVLKIKMANSNSEVVEFPSGGPRVSVI